MKYLVIVMAVIFSLFGTANAGRSGKTTISRIIVKDTHVEFFVVDAGTNMACSNPKRWHLARVNYDNHTAHPAFEAMLSGLLSAKHAGAEVDIVGTGICNTTNNGVAESIDWAVVAH